MQSWITIIISLVLVNVIESLAGLNYHVSSINDISSLSEGFYYSIHLCFIGGLASLLSKTYDIIANRDREKYS
jgi:hypothetical protein